MRSPSHPVRSVGLLCWLTAAVASSCDPAAPRESRPAARAHAQHEGTESRDDPPVGAGAEPGASVLPASTQAFETVDALSATERDQFRAAVAEGRRLHGSEDYDGAMEAFGRALDLVPDDPRTLSELGWSAIFAQRLDEADQALQRAEAGVGDDDRLRASILYNRGRVAEARGQRRAAIDSYQRSLRLRPHPSTYEHLVGLEGGTRYAFGPAVRRLQGPYAKLGEFCAQERRLSVSQRDEAEGETFGCVPDAARGSGGDAVDVPRTRKLMVPWRGVRFVETRPDPYTVRFHAALRTEEGWFVLPDVATLSKGVAGTTERVTRLAAKAEALVLSGGPQMVLEVETRWVVAEGGRERQSETHRVEFLCGVGPSDRPSCTGALPRATRARRRESGGVEQTRWSVQRQVRPEGVLVLSADAAELDEPAAALLGEHPLQFL